MLLRSLLRKPLQHCAKPGFVYRSHIRPVHTRSTPLQNGPVPGKPHRSTKGLWYSIAASTLIGMYFLSDNASAEAKNDSASSEKTYTRAEVSEHCSPETGIWVTFKDGVYDITNFIDSHPGGPEKIMGAAGGDIEAFWSLYRVHYDVPLPQQLLKQFRIGSLAASESAIVLDSNDPYANEPRRLCALKKHTTTPFNAETPTSMLRFPQSDDVGDFITPTGLWYIRHHHPVPHLNTDDFRLSVDVGKFSIFGEKHVDEDGSNLFELSVEDLKTKFPQHTVLSTMQCGGNRRNDYNAIDKTQGLPWQTGAISTAEWKGVKLSDLLKHTRIRYDAAGADTDPEHAQHVWFKGDDSPYDASIPIHKAMDPRGDVIIAYEMNGAPLPADHGAPLRAIVPGHLGARQVKWVSDIVVSQEEAESNWQRGFPYKGISPNVKKFTKSMDPSKYAAVQELPVQSAIVYANRDEKQVEVEGYAYSGGGRGIVRVDVSIDDGKTWNTADLKHPPNQNPLGGRAWAWSLFRSEVTVPADKANDNLKVICKAVDSSYNVQPDSVKGIWNLRGILNNSWHRIDVPPTSTSE